ncbi:MAG: recombinase family protein [Clostridia bacterium]|nr:recombinase family protein [Clostridia bacterium]
MPRKSKYNYENVNSESAHKIWNIAKYVRLSREDGDEKDESNSVTSQSKILDELILELMHSNNDEFIVYDTYVDDGFSGTDFNRPAFQKLLKDMRDGHINMIVTKDLSRLGRNYIEVGNYIEQIFPLFNIRFMTKAENIDSYKDPSSVNSIIVPFKNLINDEYCRDISNKIILANNARKRNGQYLGSFPIYGYKKDPENKYKLIIDDESAEVVRLIYKLFLEGKGRVTITKYLNDRGILNPTAYKQRVLKQNYVNASNIKGNSLWCDTTVSHILRNEMYTGTLIQGRKKMLSYKVHKIVDVPKENWIVVENNHEPIIDKETFNKVQDIINRDTRIKNDGTGEVSIFAGYIRCADCKRAMNKKSTNNKIKTYYYYVCNTYRKKSIGTCTKHTIRSDELENLVLKSIKMQIDIAIEMEKMIKKINQSSKRNIFSNNVEKMLNVKFNELEKVKKLKKDVYEDWKMGDISREEYIEYKSSYEKDIIKIEENIKCLEEEKEKYKEQVLGDNIWIENLKEKRNITKLTRDIIVELIDCIYVHESGDITIKFKFEDEYERILEYIKINEELTLEIRAI